MARIHLALALVAGLVACAAANDIVDAVKAAGATNYLELVKTAGGDSAFDLSGKPLTASHLVLLVPTNAALDKWVKEMGVPVSELKDRKTLAQRIVSYNTLLPKSLDINAFPKGTSRTVRTANPDWTVTISRLDDGKFYVDDSHDQIATLTPTKSPHVFLVDKLMLPGNIYPSVMALDMEMDSTIKAPFTTFLAAIERAGAKDSLLKSSDTFFVPTDEALAKAGVTEEALAKMNPEELKKVLTYHTIPGYKAIPRGFLETNGKPIPTALKGSDVTVTMAVKDGKGSATVTDAAGNVANVVAPNFFAGRSTIHGIDRVLAFEKGAAAAAPAAAAAEPAAATTAAPAAATTAPAAAEPAAAAPAADKAAPAASGKPGMVTATGKPVAAGAGRKLLQAYSRTGGLSQQLGIQNAQDAVIAALNSDDPASTARATSVGQINASYSAFPTTRGFYYVGGPGGLNGRR